MQELKCLIELQTYHPLKVQVANNANEYNEYFGF